MQFATNHLGHFALAARPARRARRRRRRPDRRRSARAAHLRSPVVFDDIHFDYRAVRAAGGLRAVQDRQRRCSRSGRPSAGPTTASPPTRCMPGAHRDQPAAPPQQACRLRRRDRVPQDAASRAPRPRSCSPPRRCSTASAAATSRTATRPSPSRAAPGRLDRRRALRPGPGERRPALGGVPARGARRGWLVREQVGVDRHQPVDVVDVAVELGDDDRVLLAGRRAGCSIAAPSRCASARSST